MQVGIKIKLGTVEKSFSKLLWFGHNKKLLSFISVRLSVALKLSKLLYTARGHNVFKDEIQNNS